MIYFPTKNILPNYKDYPALYNHYSTFTGKDVYSSYVYWILKNNNIGNIKLVGDLDETTSDDLIFFHFDNLKAFNFNTSAKKVQFISDRPLVNGCSKYLSSDITVCNEYSRPTSVLLPSFIIDKRYPVEINFFPEPLPYNLRKCKVQYPPKKAVCMGLYDNIDKELLKLIEEKKDLLLLYKNTRKLSKNRFNILNNISFELYNESNINRGDEDVFFFIRNKESGYNYAGYKHPNRLFISFYCNVPGFYYGETVLRANRKSEFDYTEISDVYDFLDKLLVYCTDEEAFLSILKQNKSRENDNTEAILVARFNQVIQQLKN